MTTNQAYCASRADHDARDECQGHANRETWSFLLLVNNDEGLQESFREYVDGTESEYVNAAADAVKGWAEGLLSYDAYEYETGSTQPAELIRMSQEIGSLDRVAWRDVARSILDDINEAALAEAGNPRVTFSTESDDLTWHSL